MKARRYLEWLRAGLQSRGLNPDAMGIKRAGDVLTGLVVAGQWAAFGEWSDARYPAYATDNPRTLLGNLF